MELENINNNVNNNNNNNNHVGVHQVTAAQVLQQQSYVCGLPLHLCTALPADHVFSWATVQRDCKALPQHTVSRVEEDGSVSFFKDMTYELLHTGGFLRLCTKRGRVYFAAQNTTFHTTPDWKMHLSVELEDIPKAWDIVAALFMHMRCDVGMKATYLGPEEWSENQRGREITVYLFRNHYTYRDFWKGLGVEDGIEAELYLGPEMEFYDTSFWFTFVTEVERRLAAAGIRSRGCADGDLPLPGCRYASLRNEAFVQINKEFVYPPNARGWNAAQHPNPYIELLFFLQKLKDKMN